MSSRSTSSCVSTSSHSDSEPGSISESESSPEYSTSSSPSLPVWGALLVVVPSSLDRSLPESSRGRISSVSTVGATSAARLDDTKMRGARRCWNEDRVRVRERSSLVAHGRR